MVIWNELLHFLYYTTVFFLDFFWGVDSISVGDTLVIIKKLNTKDPGAYLTSFDININFSSNVQQNLIYIYQLLLLKIANW